MSFVVEDGTGLPNATSYNTVQEIRDYWLSGGSKGYVDLSPYSDNEIQAASNVATTYIDQNYCFRGGIKLTTQSLEWPRINVVDTSGREYPSDAVPLNVKAATSEYAYNQLINLSTGGLQPDRNPLGIVKSESKSVGSLSKSVEYEEGTQNYSYKKLPYADNLLNKITTCGVGGLSNQVERCL